MAETRIDPIGGRKVVIADDRAARPGAFNEVAPRPTIDASDDPFAEGNESRTPPELWANRPDGGPPDGPGWLARAVPNLYPAFTADSADPPLEANADLFGASGARGAHEVIVNSPRQVVSLADLTDEEVTTVVGAWRERLAAHEGAPARHLFINEGGEAGASLAHTHAQLVATDFVPRMLASEREAFRAHAGRTNGANLLTDIVMEEIRASRRIVAIDDFAVLIAPWASAVAYQLMIVPRDGKPDFANDGDGVAPMLAKALMLLKQRFTAPPPMNLWVRSAPEGAEHWTWRIDILPRLAQPAGIELGIGLGVNPVSPERAAAELGDLAASQV